MGNYVEAQISLFNLGQTGDSEMKIVWQSTDNEKIVDLADTVVTLNGENFIMSDIKIVQESRQFRHLKFYLDLCFQNCFYYL